MSVTHGPVVIRRRLGHVLKQLRTDRDLHLSAVATRLAMSPSKLSRIETGQVEPKFRDVRDLLDIYDASADTRDQLLGWANDAKSPGWWQPFLSKVTGADLDLYNSLEAEARTELMYSLPITGLLQTEAYARTLLSDAYPSASERNLARLVEIRVGRQAVIELDREDAPPLELHAVLDEAALHRCSDPSVMYDQLVALLRRSEQPNVTVQVLPFSAGFTRAIGNFAVFEPRATDTDWTVVHVESTGDETYLDTAAEVRTYRSIWSDVTARALDPDATRALIGSLVSRSAGPGRTRPT